MKILFAASEAKPFTASGGLADVAASLPKALKAKKQTCRIVTPLYSSVKDKWGSGLKYIGNFTVPVSWRNQYCGLFEVNEGGTVYYFLDNEYYFGRAKLYGHYDDCERFAFFSRAVLEMLNYLNFSPDIIHCNDWQTALIPTYLKLFYKNSGIEKYSNIKTVFTIHNIQYQGQYGYDVLEDVLGIPYSAADSVEYSGNINLMKGAIENCDRITTVSETYAKELTDPWYAHGLNDLIVRHSGKLTGILNGIDYKQYDPANDTDIFSTFTAADLSGKARNKERLLFELGLESRQRAPLLGMVSRLVAHKGLDLVRFSFDELIQAGFTIAVLGTGDDEYQHFLSEMVFRYPGRVSVTLDFVPELAKRIYAASDMFLMPSCSEPCGLAQMIALRYGTVPIVRETGGLADSIKDCFLGKGNGFTFRNYDASEMVSAVYRALEVYNNEKNWEKLVKYCMKSNLRWSKSAGEYVKVYEEITTS
ncbi:MAG: glycogen synthase [Oscillospiraceae bacterium]|nr:glycogen synthase [Oscillospiraceae bacterium]